MSRFSISIQILIVGATAVILMALSGFFISSQIRLMHERAAETSRLVAIRANSRLFLTDMVDEETGVRGFIATRNPVFLDPLKAARAAVPALLEQLADEAQSSPEFAESLTKAKQSAAKVDQFFDGEIDRVNAGRANEAIAHLGGGKLDFDALRGAVGALEERAQHSIDEANVTFEQTSNTALQSVIASTVLTCLAVAAFSLVLGRALARRLQQVTDGLHTIVSVDFAGLTAAYDQLAAGNLCVDYQVSSRPITAGGGDEIARVAASYNELCNGLASSSVTFNAALERLRTTISGVDVIARDVRNASGAAAERVAKQSAAVRDISGVIDVVARGAMQQAEGVQSVSTAAEELSRTAEQIATGSADQAQAVQGAGAAVNRLDEQIAAFAELGTALSAAARRANEQTSGVTTAVRETASAMTALRDEAEHTGRAMTQLEERSAAVEEIVSTIDEIADQTNLLALNAAIEAARAGEHGRGFSVVADEVRKLAERAAASTRQINGILSEIRRETSATSAAVRSSVSSMEAGLTLASKAADALQQVNAAIAETTRIADDVAAGATTMRNASAEVTANVASVSAVVEENAAAASEMQTTTQLLNTAMLPIANLALEQSASASQVAQSAQTLGTLVEATAAGAGALQAKSSELAESVAGFTVDAGTAPNGRRGAQTKAYALA